jgi:hypothetical protein
MVDLERILKEKEFYSKENKPEKLLDDNIDRSDFLKQLKLMDFAVSSPSNHTMGPAI